MKIILLISAQRGLRCLKALHSVLNAKDNLIVFSFEEEPWEPKFINEIKEFCEENNYEFLVSKNINKNIETFDEADMVFAIGWRYMISKEIYEKAKIGFFVFHDSLLPSYRGFGPTVWSIRNGEKYTGTTLFKISEFVDEGDILCQKKIEIAETDYIGDLVEKITHENENIIQKVYKDIKNNEITFTKQNHEQATYTCKNIPDDFKINWKDTSKNIFNLIRSYSHPYPGAFTKFNNEKVIIWTASIDNDSRNYVGYIPGRIKSINQNKTISVFCGDGNSITIHKIGESWELAEKPGFLIKSIGGTFE